MRIVIDLQGRQSSGSKNRGIGRYSLSITKSIIRNKKEHKVFVMLSSLFPYEIAEIKNELKDLLPEENIVIWFAENDLSFLSHKLKERQALEHSRELFLESLSPDIIYITSLFEGLVDAITTSVHTFAGKALVATTLYDLIPLIHRSPYLENPDVCQWYEEKIEHLKRADLLLTISNSSAKEALDYIDADPDKVISIGTAADEQFKKIVISKIEKENLYKKYAIKNEFLMYTGGIDYRKNIERLIEAYASLDKSIRKQYQLVIVCSIEDIEKTRLEILLLSFGLKKEEVIFTGFVPENDLIMLYNLCRGFIFPSWHEGFGLPALEAMHCGAPVIVSNLSSLPEVVGLEEALFDPYSIDDMQEKITKLLTNDAYREKLLKYAAQQVKRFTWDISGKKAIEAFEKATKGRVSKSAKPVKKPRLAYISPLPPERSGISYYSAELLPVLAEYYNIDVVVEQESIAGRWINKHCKVLDVFAFKQNLQDYDRVLYHFGNSEFHQHMFDLLVEVPGVVVLHDFFLSGINSFMECTQYKNHSFEDDLFYSHGNAPFNDKNADLVFDYPTNKKVLDYAQGIIVHSQNSVKLAKEWYGKTYGHDWRVIPLLRASNVKRSKTDSRKTLNIPEDAFVVASFGIIGKTKLNFELLEAWIHSSLAKDEKSYLIFVGGYGSDEYAQNILDTIASSSYGERIMITGWTDTETFRRYLSAADVGVQLRTLSRGETSAAVLDCMNYGLATIVNANGSMADLPQDSVYMLKDDFGIEELTKALEALYRDKSKRIELGNNAQNTIKKDHNAEKCAIQYAEAIETFYSKNIVRKEGLLELKKKASQAEARASQAEARASQAEARASQAEANASQAEANANNALHHYHMVINSSSWKLTKPYRFLGRKYKWFMSNAKAWLTLFPGSRPQRVLKSVLLKMKHRINANPKLKHTLVQMLNKFPSLKARLKQLNRPSYTNSMIFSQDSSSQLSPQAKKIYDELKSEIERQKRGEKCE